MLRAHPHARAARRSSPKPKRIAATTAETFTPGDPFADGRPASARSSSAVQRDRVRGYIQKGIDEGAKLVTGGAEPPEGLDTGYFVQPTVFSDVRNDMTIAQEEIFGPVLSIIPYDDEEDAVAHRQRHGLRPRRRRVVGRPRAGQDGRAAASAPARSRSTAARSTCIAPFGGYKQSGYGRESASYGLEEFLEVEVTAALSPLRIAGRSVRPPHPFGSQGAGMPDEPVRVAVTGPPARSATACSSASPAASMLGPTSR